MKTLALLIALALPSVAAAQADPEAEHRRGMALRAEGRPVEAAAVFRALYERTRDPRALAREALAEGAAGAWNDASYHLRAALTHDADPWIVAHRADLTRDLTVIEAHAAEAAPHAPVETPPPAPAPVVVPVVVPVAHALPPAPRVVPVPDGTRTALGIAALALGGAGLVTGFGALVARNDAAGEFNATRGGHNCALTNGQVVTPAGSGLDCQGAYDRATTMQAVSVAGFVGGGLLAAAGAVLLVTAPRRVEGLALRCGVGPGDVGVSCAGVF